MQSGDGFPDVAVAVCLVAGPEEQAKRSGWTALMFVCCSVWYALIFCFYLYRARASHITRRSDPRATPDTDTPPGHIYSSRTQDFGTKRELEQKKIPRCIGRYDTRGYCGERAGKKRTVSV